MGTRGDDDRTVGEALGDIDLDSAMSRFRIVVSAGQMSDLDETDAQE